MWIMTRRGRMNKRYLQLSSAVTLQLEYSRLLFVIYCELQADVIMLKRLRGHQELINEEKKVYLESSK